jgi:type IV pilus assembly protein PilP
MRSLTMLGAGLLALALTACDPDSTAERAGSEEAAPAAKPVKDAVVEESSDEDLDDFAYNPIGKRDPFRSFFRSGPDRSIASPTPLQRFEVDQYHLVGIVWGISNPRAMVEDPEAMGHVIEVGTYIGKNWGKVTQINSGSVIITEEYQTIDGELVTNQIVLELPVEELTQ